VEVATVATDATLPAIIGCHARAWVPITQGCVASVASVVTSKGARAGASAMSNPRGPKARPKPGGAGNSDVVWFISAAEDFPEPVEEWSRTFGVGLNGVTWAPAAVAGDEATVMLIAANHGITPVLWGPHWFLPTRWIARTYPRLRARMARVEARANEAMRSSNPLPPGQLQ
jgi:hypothetical protein